MVSLIILQHAQVRTCRHIKNSRSHQVLFNNSSNKSKFLSTPLPEHVLKFVTYQICSDIKNSVNLQ